MEKSIALYRKYRPQKFSELIGQNHIRITLENEIKTGRVAHAYLFSGPRGVGKTTTARIFAKAINCLDRKKAEPCNQCRVCKEIVEGRSLDLVEIDAASHTQVDNVRENIIPNAQTPPTNYKYKVFIIDEVHMLSISAFNALLKIIEEPPPYVIFILCTTEIHRVPETIISRCQRFDFKRIGLNDLVRRLKMIATKEEIEVKEKVLEQIARLAQGSSRDAESLLAQIFSLGEKKITDDIAKLVLPHSDIDLILRLFEILIRKQQKEGIQQINEMVEEGVDLVYFIKEFIDFLRKAMLLKINVKLDIFSLMDLDKDQEKKVLELLKEVSLAELIKMINVFMFKQKDLKSHDIPQLPLELAILELSSQEDKEILLEKSSSSTTSKKMMTNGGVEERKKSKTKLDLSLLWPQFLALLRQKNHALAFLFKTCHPLEITDNELVVACNYKFHEERIKEKNNLNLIEDILEQVSGAKLKLKTIVKAKVEDDDEGIRKLLENF